MKKKNKKKYSTRLIINGCARYNAHCEVGIGGASIYTRVQYNTCRFYDSAFIYGN